jgi:tRNA (mo5U34)-methyltransferase
LWILGKVGFSRVSVLPPPPDAYEQLLHHKRVMVAAQV